MKGGALRVLRAYHGSYSDDVDRLITEQSDSRRASAKATSAFCSEINNVLLRLSRNRVLPPHEVEHLVETLLWRYGVSTPQQARAVKRNFEREITFGMALGSSAFHPRNGDAAPIMLVWDAYYGRRGKRRYTFSGIELEIAVSLALLGDRNAVRNCKGRNIR